MRLRSTPLKDESDQESSAAGGEIIISGDLEDKNTAIGNNAAEAAAPMEESAEMIQQRIQARVDELNKRDEWTPQESYSENPMDGKSDVEVMIDQMKSVKPFDSVEELVSDYTLMLGTTAFFAVVIFLFQTGLDNAMTWFMRTDFDSDFLETVLKSNS
jgi:hypothetical protein